MMLLGTWYWEGLGHVELAVRNNGQFLASMAGNGALRWVEVEAEAGTEALRRAVYKIDCMIYGSGLR